MDMSRNIFHAVRLSLRILNLGKVGDQVRDESQYILKNTIDLSDGVADDAQADEIGKLTLDVGDLLLDCVERGDCAVGVKQSSQSVREGLDFLLELVNEFLDVGDNSVGIGTERDSLAQRSSV